MKAHLIVFLFIFIDFASGLNLQCSVTSSSTWNEVSGGLCSSSRLSVTTENVEIITINGLSAPMPDIKIFSASSQAIYYIPKNFGDFFPNLEVFYATSSSMQRLSASDLKQFPHLREINLNVFGFQSIDGDLFKYNVNMTRVVFTTSQMTYIGEKLLDRLPNFISTTFSGGCLGSKTYTRRKQISVFKADVRKSCQSSGNRKNTFETEALKGNLGIASWYYYMSSKNRISSIETKPKSITLTCNLLDQSDFCKVEDLILKYRNTAISQVEDEIGGIIQNNSVNYLEIVDQQAFYLPYGINDHFSSLKNLSVVRSGLFSIEPKTFDGMTSLENLTLTENLLHEIPGNAFKSLENLKLLNLSYNKIMDLDENGFAGLKKLEILLLNDNKIEMIRDTTFDSLEKLKNLTLQRNSLKYIGVNILSKLTNLVVLDMINNECIDLKFPENALEKIQETFLGKCIAPAELQCWFSSEREFVSESKMVSGYSCKAKDGFTVKYAKTKAVLELSEHNQSMSDDDVTAFLARNLEIKFIPYGMSEIFRKIQILAILESKLSSILNRDFEGLGTLKEIIITNNQISVIENEAFVDVPNLEYLDLFENRISTLPSKVFSTLGNLKTLVISANPLKTLKFDIIPQFSVIEEFHAFKCDLEIIETRILKYMKRAKVINLEQNNCTDIYYKKEEMKLTEIYLDINIHCCYDNCF